MQLRKAVKRQCRGRLALIGPTGSGKTYTALKVARAMLVAMGKPNGRVALIDTEHESSEKYADLFDFEILTLTTFGPDTYTEAIKVLGDDGVDIGIIDSLSHAWSGKDGALELVDRKAASGNGNKFTAWGSVTPMQNRMIEAMLASPMHLIVTMRSSMEYVQEKDAQGKTTIRKVGMQPVQRAGVEYEFDFIGDLDTDHVMTVGKTRCPELDGQVFSKPGKELAEQFVKWLAAGVPVAEPEKPLELRTLLKYDAYLRRAFPNDVAALEAIYKDSKGVAYTIEQVGKWSGSAAAVKAAARWMLAIEQTFDLSGMDAPPPPADLAEDPIQ